MLHDPTEGTVGLAAESASAAAAGSSVSAVTVPSTVREEPLSVTGTATPDASTARRLDTTLTMLPEASQMRICWPWVVEPSCVHVWEARYLLGVVGSL